VSGNRQAIEHAPLKTMISKSASTINDQLLENEIRLSMLLIQCGQRILPMKVLKQFIPILIGRLRPRFRMLPTSAANQGGFDLQDRNDVILAMKAFLTGLAT
jgi:hypothetical protein